MKQTQVPVGPKELALVEASGSREWSPRLPDQVIVYPVLQPGLRRPDRRDWNVKASGAGYVTRFGVKKDFSTSTTSSRPAAESSAVVGDQ